MGRLTFLNEREEEWETFLIFYVSSTHRSMMGLGGIGQRLCKLL
jgi:hypothetical protein